MRILILGGTTEAVRLAERLAGRPGIEATLSLAGRTHEPAPQALPTRVGGFGGVSGLAAYLKDNGIDLLIDATHPFAAQISLNAVAAAAMAGVALIRYTRPPWEREPGDNWLEVDSLEAAAEALAGEPKCVFLTVGRLGRAAVEVAPQHHYVVRSIDPPDELNLPDHRLLLERGPFDEASQAALMQAERVEIMVTKNAGGDATYGKVAAARSLGLPVIMVQPPASPDVTTYHELNDVLAAIEAHGASLAAERGV